MPRLWPNWTLDGQEHENTLTNMVMNTVYPSPKKYSLEYTNFFENIVWSLPDLRNIPRICPLTKLWRKKRICFYDIQEYTILGCILKNIHHKCIKYTCIFNTKQSTDQYKIDRSRPPKSTILPRCQESGVRVPRARCVSIWYKMLHIVHSRV